MYGLLSAFLLWVTPAHAQPVDCPDCAACDTADQRFVISNPGTAVTDILDAVNTIIGAGAGIYCIDLQISNVDIASAAQGFNAFPQINVESNGVKVVIIRGLPGGTTFTRTVEGNPCDAGGDTPLFRFFDIVGAPDASPGNQGRLELCDLRFRQGDVGLTGGRDGGAICVLNADLRMSNCAFERNRAQQGGAVASNNNVEVCDVRYEDNVSQVGGGAYHELSPFLDIDFELIYQNGGLVFGSPAGFFRNAAILAENPNDRPQFAGRGGGMFIQDGTIQITGLEFGDRNADGSVFDGNHADVNGGGLAITGAPQVDEGGFILDCSFFGNSAVVSGGGLDLSSNASQPLLRCVFNQNVAGATGGGMSTNEVQDHFVLSCVFDGNRATRGAGVYNRQPNVATYRFCCFIDNVAGSFQFVPDVVGADCQPMTVSSTGTNFRGGGAETEGPSIITFDACRFLKNSAALGGGYADNTSNPNQDQFARNIRFFNSVFDSNTASEGGAAFFSESDDTTRIRLLHVTMGRNQADPGAGADGTGGVLARFAEGTTDQFAPIEILNSVIYHNTGSTDTQVVGTASLPLAINYSDIQNIASIVPNIRRDATIPFNALSNVGIGNMDDDPKFVGGTPTCEICDVVPDSLGARTLDYRETLSVAPADESFQFDINPSLTVDENLPGYCSNPLRVMRTSPVIDNALSITDAMSEPEIGLSQSSLGLLPSFPLNADEVIGGVRYNPCGVVDPDLPQPFDIVVRGDIICVERLTRTPVDSSFSFDDVDGSFLPALGCSTDMGAYELPGIVDLCASPEPAAGCLTDPAFFEADVVCAETEHYVVEWFQVANGDDPDLCPSMLSCDPACALDATPNDDILRGRLASDYDRNALETECLDPVDDGNGRFSVTLNPDGGLLISEIVSVPDTLTVDGDPIVTRYVELANTSGAPINLSGFSLLILNNGAPVSPNISQVLPAVSLDPGETFVFSYSDAGDFERVFCSIPDADTSPDINGDDVVVLLDTPYPGGNQALDQDTIVDVYGVIGVDGTGQVWDYQNSYAFRDRCVRSPNPVFTPSEWVFHTDTNDADTSFESDDLLGTTNEETLLFTRNRARPGVHTFTDRVRLDISSVEEGDQGQYYMKVTRTAVEISDQSETPVGVPMNTWATDMNFVPDCDCEVDVTCPADLNVFDPNTVVIAPPADAVCLGDMTMFTATVTTDPNPANVVTARLFKVASDYDCEQDMFPTPGTCIVGRDTNDNPAACSNADVRYSVDLVSDNTVAGVRTVEFKFVINNVMLSDEGRFVVIVDNMVVVGGEVFMCDPACDDFDLSLLKDTQITGQTITSPDRCLNPDLLGAPIQCQVLEVIKVCEGDMVMITVPACVEPSQPYSIEWYKRDPAAQDCPPSPAPGLGDTSVIALNNVGNAAASMSSGRFTAETSARDGDGNFTAKLTIDPTQAGDEGDYYVIIRGFCGDAVSGCVTVMFYEPVTIDQDVTSIIYCPDPLSDGSTPPNPMCTLSVAGDPPCDDNMFNVRWYRISREMMNGELFACDDLPSSIIPTDPNDLPVGSELICDEDGVSLIDGYECSTLDPNTFKLNILVQGTDFFPNDEYENFIYFAVIEGCCNTVVSGPCCIDVQCRCPDCEPWDNGEFDLVDGQISQCGSSLDQTFERFLADDFILPCDGTLYRMKQFNADLFTNIDVTNPENLLVKVIIWKQAEWTTVPDNGGTKPAFTLVKVAEFDPELVEVTPTGDQIQRNGETYRVVRANLEPVSFYLEGGVQYFITFAGVVPSPPPNPPSDIQWYWGTTGNEDDGAGNIINTGVKGTYSVALNDGDVFWCKAEYCVAIDTCCSDLNFCLDADECKIQLDNTFLSDPVRGSPSISSSTNPARDGRTADDVFIAPDCAEPVKLCVVRAYMLSNCPLEPHPLDPDLGFFPRAFLDVYQQSAESRSCISPLADDPLPEGTLVGVRNTNVRLVDPTDPDAVLDANDPADVARATVTIPTESGSIMLPLYCFEWDFELAELPAGLVEFPKYPGGCNLWFSAYGDAQDNFAARSIWVFADRNLGTGERKTFLRGAIGRGPAFDPYRPTRWYLLHEAPEFGDLTDQPTEPQGVWLFVSTQMHEPPTASTPTATACLTDMDGSGSTDVGDILDFLAIWTIGCP